MELVPALCNGGSDSRVEFWRGRSRGTPAELEALAAVPSSAGFVQKLCDFGGFLGEVNDLRVELRAGSEAPSPPPRCSL